MASFTSAVLGVDSRCSTRTLPFSYSVIQADLARGMPSTGYLVLCPTNTLHYSDTVQSLFVSDIEHFVSQTDAEGCVKNHRLSEGLKARVSVI